jgi:hypothetical protein
MTVLERLKGCPTGATYHALRLFHTDEEIRAAVATGEVTSEVRSYANPPMGEVEWFYAKRMKGYRS